MDYINFYIENILMQLIVRKYKDGKFCFLNNNIAISIQF